jgi:hypothetical protein
MGVNAIGISIELFADMFGRNVIYSQVKKQINAPMQ